MNAGADQAYQAALWDHDPEQLANWHQATDIQGLGPAEEGPQVGLWVAEERFEDRPSRLAVPDTRMKQSDHNYDPQQPFLRVDFDCLDLLSLLKENRISIASEDTSHYIQMQFPDTAFHTAMRIIRDWGHKTNRGVFIRKQPFRGKRMREMPATNRASGPNTGRQRPQQQPQQLRQDQPGYDFSSFLPPR